MFRNDQFQIIITGKGFVKKTPGTYFLTHVFKHTKKLNAGFRIMKLDLFAHFTLVTVRGQ